MSEVLNAYMDSVFEGREKERKNKIKIKAK